MYRLRNARSEDLPGLFQLARILNTLNLPPDEAVLQELLRRSVRSFAGGQHPTQFDPKRHFTFVLEDPQGKVVGTSALHAQHGTPDSPHTFFRVQEVERCTTIQPLPGLLEPRVLHHHHTVLHLARTFDGPTEVGGLVLSPECRGKPGKLGTLLSLGRFMYAAIARRYVRPQMLAEVLPPLGQDDKGRPTSPLWDALGAKFTGLSYDEADKLSRTHLDLIPQLFPEPQIYASLMPQAAQDVIGKVGEGSKGAAHLLAKIGFSARNEVDPFDGGPHYYANTDELAPIAKGRWARAKLGDPQTQDHALVACVQEPSGEFRAVRALAQHEGEDLVLSRQTLEALEQPEGSKLWVWGG